MAPLEVDELEELGVAEPAGRMVQATVRIVPQAELLLAGNRYAGEGPSGGPGRLCRDGHRPLRDPGQPDRPVACASRPRHRDGLGRSGDLGRPPLRARCGGRREPAGAQPRRVQRPSERGDECRVPRGKPVRSRRRRALRPRPVQRALCGLSPDTRYAFRDGGAYSDGFSEHLVRETPGHLEEGGFAHLLIAWVVEGEDWAARPRHWLRGDRVRRLAPARGLAGSGHACGDLERGAGARSRHVR